MCVVVFLDVARCLYGWPVQEDPPPEEDYESTDAIGFQFEPEVDEYEEPEV